MKRHNKLSAIGAIASILFIIPTVVVSQIATTSINVSTTVMANPKLLLGITYDCRSSLTGTTGSIGYHNTDGTFISSIDSIFNDFPMAGLRYPANGIMQGFEWKKSIGPISNRIPQQLFSSQSMPAQVLNFGFDEFMGMTAARGVDPKNVQIMVPIYDSADGSLTSSVQINAAIPNVVQSNADWVEYCNSPNDGTNPGGGTDWAALRAANGHALPYRIKIWNMGNEPYHVSEFDVTGAAAYIAKIIPIIDAMRAIDPTIQITVTVVGKVSSGWTQTILNSPLLQGKIYGINTHYFLTENATAGVITQGVAAIQGFLTPLAAAAQTNGYKMIVGDQAHAILSNGPSQAEQDTAMQWQGASVTVDFLLAMSQISNLERSDYWTYGLTSATWHPIRKNTNGTYTLMPTAAMYKKLFPLFLDNSVAVTNTSPSASDGNPYAVRSSAFASSDLSHLNVIAVNRDKNNAFPLQVNGITGYTLNSSKILTATSLDAEVFTESAITIDNNGNYLMPAMSILVLEYSQTSLGIEKFVSTSNEINVYPNPANNIISFSETLNNIEIYNITGELVISKIAKTNSLSTSGLIDGTYILKSDKGTIKFNVKH
ncbi:MAG: T9SS type A sorting domain-containing protein [Bacteroidota bacterium]